MTDFSVKPITEHDLNAIGDLTDVAFHQNPRTLSYQIFSRSPNDRAEVIEWSRRMTELTYRRTPNITLNKLVHNESGKISGYILWQSPRTKGNPDQEAQRIKAEEAVEQARKELGLPPETNEARLFHFEQEQDRLREKYVDPCKDYVLKMLAVLPEYRGQGGASLLLQAFLAIVDAADAKAWLESTPDAVSMYEKLGWRAIDTIVSEIDKEGGSPEHVTCGMMRPAALSEFSPST